MKIVVYLVQICQNFKIFVIVQETPRIFRAEYKLKHILFLHFLERKSVYLQEKIKFELHVHFLVALQ
jgi:hypothetical protein